MLSASDKAYFDEHGWLRVAGAVPRALCGAVVTVLARDLGVPLDDPERWPEHLGPMRDLIPLWGHQALWDIRQLPRLHAIWSALWDTEALLVSLDSCRFTPPWRPGAAEALPLHWDHDPRAARPRMIQGVVALTDTAADQGGFRCVPSLLREPGAWPARPTIDADGDEEWNADTAFREIVHVAARAGDLIVWNSLLPHGNSRNRAARPRLAFYVQMFPADGTQGQANVESWRTGRCVPWWRTRPGYDRIEPWPPAQLTPLGRRLLGIETWPTH